VDVRPLSWELGGAKTVQRTFDRKVGGQKNKGKKGRLSGPVFGLQFAICNFQFSIFNPSVRRGSPGWLGQETGHNRWFPVLEGRLIIAQRFIAGFATRSNVVPRGTTEKGGISVVPLGTESSCDPQPSDKSLGYSQMPLRGRNLLWPLFGAGLPTPPIPVLEGRLILAQRGHRAKHGRRWVRNAIDRLDD